MDGWTLYRAHRIQDSGKRRGGGPGVYKTNLKKNALQELCDLISSKMTKQPDEIFIVDFILL